MLPIVRLCAGVLVLQRETACILPSFRIFITRGFPSKARLTAAGDAMGGYSSTPRKGKTSEEGTIEELSYAASGMQVSPDGMFNALQLFLFDCLGTEVPTTSRINAASFLFCWLYI